MDTGDWSREERARNQLTSESLADLQRLRVVKVATRAGRRTHQPGDTGSFQPQLFESEPLTKTIDACGSTSAKPRKSVGLSFRCVFEPTMPLIITNTPADSAFSRSRVTAPSHERCVGPSGDALQLLDRRRLVAIHPGVVILEANRHASSMAFGTQNDCAVRSRSTSDPLRSVHRASTSGRLFFA